MLSELNMVGNWFKNEPDSSWQFDEIKFDDEAKRIFETLALDIQLLDYSARINMATNHTYIPCHYFLYALKLQPLVSLANKYISVFDLLKEDLATPEDIASLIHSPSPSHFVTDNLDPYSRNNFFDVFKDKNKRLKAKDIINGNGADTSLRGNDDFVRSIILKAIPVPDVSSDMLGRLIYSFSQSPTALEVLVDKYTASIPYLFRAESGDDLLFKIISTLGWQGKLESLFENASTRTIGWGGLNDTFLLSTTPVAGHTQYLDVPVHYSESQSKYIHIKKGILNTIESLEKASKIISTLWPNMSIDKNGSEFLFKSSERIKVTGLKFEGASNKIFYGAPGTGKSHKIFTVECKDAEKVITVFHPDTQYNDFVGALKPKMEKDNNGATVVTYQFRPGPFTKALVTAKTNPNKHICLVIEEINRAPAAAVFGELFQLLDRNKNGESTYKIDAADPDMLLYINEQICSAGFPDLTQLEIPANLSLLATMNSSDQAVMPLDTAFKRRWSFEYLGIDFSHADVPRTDISINTENGLISIKWPELAEIINYALVESGVAEDRLIGPFFLNKIELESSSSAKEALKSKLFVYLCDDVLRHLGYEKLFSSAYKTFSRLSSAFNNDLAVFNSAIELKIEEKGTKVAVEEAPLDAAE
jgi:hypothetical protein